MCCSHGLGCIEDGAVGGAYDVAGNDLVGVVTEGLGSSSLHSVVDLLLGYLTLNNCHENGGRAGGGGNALSRADELAVELGDNKADSLCSAGGVRNNVDSACAGTAEIAFALGTVEDHLIAGVGVDSAHDTAHNGGKVVKSLGHGSEAVGGAGSSRNNGILCLKDLVVYIVNNGGKVVACGSRDNNLAGACLDVGRSLFFRGVETGALEDNVNAQLAPGKIFCLGLCINGDLLTVYGDGAACCAFVFFVA